MSKKVIVYKDADGSCGVISPTEEELKKRSIKEIAKTDILVAEYHICNSDRVPSDKNFRQAWVYTKKGIDIDMEKARQMHLERIRKVRNSKWPDFDNRYTIAQRDGEDLKKLEKERKTLKNIPQKIEPLIKKAKTPEELIQIWPKELKV